MDTKKIKLFKAVFTGLGLLLSLGTAWISGLELDALVDEKVKTHKN